MLSCHRDSLKSIFVLQFTRPLGQHLPQEVSLGHTSHFGHQRIAKDPTGMRKTIYMLIHTVLRKIMMVIITKGQLTAI